MKYLPFKSRKGANPLATMLLWREDAEKAYWESDDPSFLVNIPPEILRSYTPGTGLAAPTLPNLVLEHAQGQVHYAEDLFDASDDAKAAEMKRIAHSISEHADARKRVVITRLENIVENALRRDGTVIRHLIRPYNEWSCIAVQSTLLAVPLVPARGRGNAASGAGLEPTTAMHVSVQRAAFRAHPIALMAYPEKFDEQLTRKEFAPRVHEFAAELAQLYERWVLSGRVLPKEHHAAINQALLGYAQLGSGAPKEYPLLALMREDEQAASLLETALNLTTDVGDAIVMVLNEMQAPSPAPIEADLKDFT